MRYGELQVPEQRVHELELQLRQFRRTTREFLRAIRYVPMRAIDCDQEVVDRLQAKLCMLSAYRL